ncbi:MAG: cysteine hydrolase, partial [Burkholderiales bacterium]|nr:cysteine hydrolase [Burkholderiales bacterium]
MSERLEPARTCLLLFDFLRGHVEREEEARKRYAPVIANAARLLDAARKARS